MDQKEPAYYLVPEGAYLGEVVIVSSVVALDVTSDVQGALQVPCIVHRPTEAVGEVVGGVPCTHNHFRLKHFALIKLKSLSIQFHSVTGLLAHQSDDFLSLSISTCDLHQMFWSCLPTLSYGTINSIVTFTCLCSLSKVHCIFLQCNELPKHTLKQLLTVAVMQSITTKTGQQRTTSNTTIVRIVL